VTATEALILFVAAFAAGAINSIAGGGTLVTFPTLVWLGRDPVIANATNAVALCPGSLAAMVGFRDELQRVRRWMLFLGVPSVIGGIIGAVLLLMTPSDTFARIVPFLILFATALFALQAPITRALHHAPREPMASWWSGTVLFQLAVAIYGGYFGAGIGILMLASLGLSGFTDLHEMIALRNLGGLCINGVAAVYFVARGAVNWPDAIVMTLGQIAGGYGGATLARRLGRPFIRRAVIIIGVAMGVSLLFS
jgi:uncharacterized membrane protein YfcA